MGNPEKVSITWKDGNKGKVVTDFQHFISEDEIIQRTAVLAEQIAEHTATLAETLANNLRRLHLVYVALGGFFWAGDLGRAIRRQDPAVQITFDSLRIETRGNGTTSSGTVRPFAALAKPWLLQDSTVIVIDEVVDSGLTLDFVTDGIRRGVPENKGSETIFYPSLVAVAALVDKPSVQKGRVTVNYPGFEVPDNWLIGCGMDHAEQGRELPAIYQRTAEHRGGNTVHFEPATSYDLPQTISPLVLVR